MIDETEYLPSTCSSLKIHQQNVVYKSKFLVILKFYIIINKSPCGVGLDNTVEWQLMVVDAIESWEALHCLHCQTLLRKVNSAIENHFGLAMCISMHGHFATCIFIFLH